MATSASQIRKEWTGPSHIRMMALGVTKPVVLAAVLFILPVTAYLFSSMMIEERGPYWLAENFDPEYAYLFNALNLINLPVPQLVEHPDTTLHVLGAIVIKLLTLDRTVSETTELVLADPEYYLSTISHTLRILNLISLFALGVVC